MSGRELGFFEVFENPVEQDAENNTCYRPKSK